MIDEQTNAYNKIWLIKRIPRRIQALDERGLSKRACRRAAELARDADVRLTSPQVDVTAPIASR
jgi:hypothetical protein